MLGFFSNLSPPGKIFKNQIGFALGDRILELILSAQHFTTFFAEIPFFDKKLQRKKTWHEITLKNAVE